MRPLVLLDIDGVCNLLKRRSQEGPLTTSAIIEGYRIELNPEHPAMIARFASTGAELMWATMWEDKAALHFAPEAGFGHDWKHIDFYDHWESSFDTEFDDIFATGYDDTESHGSGSSIGSLKWPGILATAGKRPFVWIDDDLADWQIEWAETRSAQGIPTLMVRPRPHIGMTPDDAELIVEFLQAAMGPNAT